MNTPLDLQTAALSRDGQNLRGLQSRICTRVRTLFGAWLTAPFLYLLLFWPSSHLEIFHQRQFFFSLSFWWCTISHPETKYLGENLIQFGFFGTPNFFTFLQQETNICMKSHENEHFPSNPTHPPFDWPNLARGASFFSSRILLTKIWFWYNKLFIFANITNNLVNFLESRSLCFLLRQGFKGYLTFCLTLLVKDFMKIQSNNILKCNIAAKFGLNFAKVCYTAPAKFDFQNLHSTKSEYSD